jgi:hypothetical protein
VKTPQNQVQPATGAVMASRLPTDKVPKLLRPNFMGSRRRHFLSKPHAG